MQVLVDERLIAAGHDISDGGIIVTLLEMAFAGNYGIQVDLPASRDDSQDPFATFFAEELGVVLEVRSVTYGV